MIIKPKDWKKTDHSEQLELPSREAIKNAIKEIVKRPMHYCDVIKEVQKEKVFESVPNEIIFKLIKEVDKEWNPPPKGEDGGEDFEIPEEPFTREK